MVTINDSTLRANVFETIYDLVSAVSWGLDSSATVTVTAAFVDDDRALPQVVINPVDVDTMDYVFDRSLIDREIRVAIEVYAKKAKDLDQMSDKILNTLETASTPGIRLVDTSENVAMSSPAGLKIRSKSIGLTYIRRS